jgi:hypothetical protein
VRSSSLRIARFAPSTIVAVVALGFAPARGAAYLIDANDARVVDHGTVELELQPAGYLQTLIGDEVQYLVAPSAQIHWGFGDGWDVLLLTRGFGVLGGGVGESPYSLAEQMVAFRAMLRDGRYSDEDAEGPSLTLQVGALLPGVEAEPGVGATAALLFAQQWDEGTLHLNAWANLTQARIFNLFLAAVVEGPGAWPVRPTVEVFFDVDDGEPYLSGLLGAVGDVDDAFSIQAGARVGGWEGYLELEVRVSSWIYWEVWDPATAGRRGRVTAEGRRP